MAVAKLFPFRRGDQLLFRGKLNGSDVSVFKPFRRGDQMLLRGKDASGDVVLGWPYRRGNQLLARTIASGGETGCCYYYVGDTWTVDSDATVAECDALGGQWFPEDECDIVPPVDTTVCGCVENAEGVGWRFGNKVIVNLSGFSGWARGYTYTSACGRESVPWDCEWSNSIGGGTIMASDAWRIEENWNEINGFHELDSWWVTELPGQDNCFWEKSWGILPDECNCPYFCDDELHTQGAVGVTILVTVGKDFWRRPDGEVWEYIYVECMLNIGGGSYSGLVASGSGAPMIMANYNIPEDAIDDESGYPTTYGDRIVIGTRKFLNADLTEPAEPQNYISCTQPPYGPIALTWVTDQPPSNWCEAEPDAPSDLPGFPYEGVVTPPYATVYFYWVDD